MKTGLTIFILVLYIFPSNDSHPLINHQIHVVHDKKSGKPRGYAFIEYEHERDMHSKYQIPSLP